MEAKAINLLDLLAGVYCHRFFHGLLATSHKRGRVQKNQSFKVIPLHFSDLERLLEFGLIQIQTNNERNEINCLKFSSKF